MTYINKEMRIYIYIYTYIYIYRERERELFVCLFIYSFIGLDNYLLWVMISQNLVRCVCVVAFGDVFRDVFGIFSGVVF